MKSVKIFVGLVCVLLVASLAKGDGYTSVTHAELQSLYDGGQSLDDVWVPNYKSYWDSLHPTTSFTPIQMIGVVINNPGDMLDFSLSSTLASGPQWQTFIQSVSPDTYGGYTVGSGDFGGTAMYMMQKSRRGSANHYPDAEWTNSEGTGEVDRLNNPYMINTTTKVSLQTGDVVLVEAKAPGMHYGGKYNVNERHFKDSAYDFSIKVLERDVTPTVTDITLADLKDASDNFIFNTGAVGVSGSTATVLTRASGCERHQGTLVHLDHLTLQSGDYWSLDNFETGKTPLTVNQKDGDITRTFSLVLGHDYDLTMTTAEAKRLEDTEFSITAILDQEAATNGADGYRLWLTDRENLTITPEPGSLVLLLAGFATLGLIWRRRIGR